MDQDFAGVLVFCNEVRQKLGRQPVRTFRKGTPTDPQRCAVGSTINFRARRLAFVDSAAVTLIDDSAWGAQDTEVARTPRVVADFLAAFDTHELPELIGEGWAE